MQSFGYDVLNHAKWFNFFWIIVSGKYTNSVFHVSTWQIVLLHTRTLVFSLLSRYCQQAEFRVIYRIFRFYYLTAESSSDCAVALISQLTWCSESNIKLLPAFKSIAFQSLCGLYWQYFVYNNPPLSTVLVLSLGYLLHLSPRRWASQAHINVIDQCQLLRLSILI